MATNSNPYVDRFPWSNVVIGNILVPGILESIEGCEKVERWIFQQGLAVSNSVSVWRGTKLAESIRITTRLYNTASFDAAYDLRNALRPKVGRKPPVLPILGGPFGFVGITRVSVLNIIPPKVAPGNSWLFGVELIEYNPPKPVPVGPADPPKKETENDRLQKEFSRLVDEARKL